jgi:branched-chain amino acid transport system ATP-binding protein
MSVLEAAFVEVAIGGASILRGVSFAIAAGETVALVGRNGAGKTTMLRAIMGLVALRGGSLRLDGSELAGVPAHARPALGVGYAPEDRRLFTAFTVEANIRLPGEVAGLTAAEIDRRLGQVYEILPELCELADRPAGTVSGGQGKMVALGRALMVGTRLLLLDEPFQGLAPALAASYGAALRRLRDANRAAAMIVTESNPDLLQPIASRVLTIERGEVGEVGERGDVGASP